MTVPVLPSWITGMLVDLLSSSILVLLFVTVLVGSSLKTNLAIISFQVHKLFFVQSRVVSVVH